MTPKERIEKLFKKEPIDTMPVFSGQGMVTIQAIKKMGIRFPQVHTSAEYLADSARITAEMFGFDAVIIPYDMCTIPEALGRGVSLYDKSEDILYPTVPYKWEKLEDVTIPDDFLKMGRMPMVDEAFQHFEGQTGWEIRHWRLGPGPLHYGGTGDRTGSAAQRRQEGQGKGFGIPRQNDRRSD